MPDTRHQGARPAPGIDLQPFYPVFFAEAGEHLLTMEQLLRGLACPAGVVGEAQVGQPVDTQVLNAIFRCAHSVKGGAATFGLHPVAALTHQMETLLDRLRRGALAPTAAMVDVLLATVAALRALLAQHTGADAATTPPVLQMTQALRLAFDSLCAGPPGLARPAPAAVRVLALTVSELADDVAADGLAELFNDIPGLGTLQPLQAAGPADAGNPRRRPRRFKLSTTSSDSDLLDLFSLHLPRQAVHLATYSVPDSAPAITEPAQPSPTLRVSADKRRRAGLAGPERPTHGVQAAVLSIPMVPISTLFNRFPRMLRDLAARLGKQVRLVTVGASTELDKRLVEKITDPLIHLLRNGCDHGIEPPAERQARGKPKAGTLTLQASHQGGGFVIEVGDDGRGMDRQRLIRSAREQGMDVPDSISDPQAWNLAFVPGLSTAETVTEVSGRGVGMDVVKQNIEALGGSVLIDSSQGRGMRVTLRLPLKLAPIDGPGVAGNCRTVPVAEPGATRWA